MAAGDTPKTETEDEKAAREAREEGEYRKRLTAAAEQSARQVAFSIRRDTKVRMEERDGRPFPVLLVDGNDTPIEMLSDATITTADGPKPPRRPTVKRIGELLKLAKLAASVAP